MWIGSRRPWTLYGSTESQTTEKTEADIDSEKQSEEVVMKSEPAADDSDDILHRGRYYRSEIGDVKEEADDHNRDDDSDDDDDDDDDGDNNVDLYPGYFAALS